MQTHKPEMFQTPQLMMIAWLLKLLMLSRSPTLQWRYADREGQVREKVSASSIVEMYLMTLGLDCQNISIWNQPSSESAQVMHKNHVKCQIIYLCSHLPYSGW